ncbi:MAG TPA: amino acid adenylation domain-containing protein, partial [Candidatus Tectomicrobia bacterium]
MHQETIEGFCLSPQQAHLWRLQSGEQGQPYWAQCTVSIDGPLDTERFQVALATVVRRQEILRTTFRCLPAMTLPLQVIAEHLAVALQTHDVSGWLPQEQAARVEALVREMSQTPVDLAYGPLLQVALVRLALHRHLLLLSLPAMSADAVGLENIVRELSRCYGTGLGGEELADVPLQYVDLAEWQQELLVSEETKAGREYWRGYDMADQRTLGLPFERAATVASAQSVPPGFAPQCHTVTVDGELVRQIEALAQQRATSLAVLLLAGWQILLWRLTGQSDMLVGVAYDGRKYAELKDALGLFAKYLPVQSHLADNYCLSRLLEQVGNSTRELYKWQEYFAWEHLVGSPGEVGEPSFFPFCFDYTEQPARYTAGDTTFAICQHYTCIDRFKVKLSCAHGREALSVTLHYDSQCYLPEDIARLADQFLTVLQSIIGSPEATISALETLSKAEREQLLKAFNNTQTAYASQQPIHHLVETQAACHPDAIAVVVEDRHLSYEALNGRANQLAHYLRGLGIGPEALVAVGMERSLDMVVGMLGILKAGGAYVPLDPVLPQARLAGMVEEARPRVLLTQERLLARLPTPGGPVVCLDTEWEVISRHSAENPSSGVRPEHLAYVLFTSGSTGQPKGVAVAHDNLCNYVHSIAERLVLPAGASYATVSTFAADLGHTAIFPALVTGGCLHVVSQECATDPNAFADYFRRHAIDCLKIVPSHLAALLGSLPSGEVLPRQRLVMGGEACGWDLVERVRKLAPECLIFNHYGPTETTVGVLTHAIAPGEAAVHTATVPLGRPLGNTQVYLLDAQLRPVPIGVPGEVYIGGANVARGYLQQPALTAERFLPDPFSGEPSARLYRTGDMARHRPDGVIEFLGRLDHQVKLRGFRIELGEIEAVLRQHAKVRESVVVMREDEPGGQRLVAYVVVPPETALLTRELRRFVQERLPEYMVPAAVVPLTALPLTVNGKVDRGALPAPEGIRLGLDSHVMAPRTLLEELLAGIWAEILRVEQVGMHESFFDLGGHSLMATQLISRVRQACQVELPLRSLFDAPTVAGMAERIEMAKKTGADLQAPPLTRTTRDGELPLSFAQQRLWFLDQLEPGSAFYNIFAPVQLKGFLDLPALAQTFTEVMRRHEILRTHFPTVEGRPIQVIAPATAMRLPVVDLQALPGRERQTAAQRVATEEAQRPFDLANGPVVRVLVLHLEAEEYLVLVTMHHIVSDGWSAGVLLHEVAALYDAFATGQPSPLAELPLQYADFAAWQRQWLQDDVLERQLAYWKHQLGPPLPMLQLPMDRPRPAVQRFRGARQALHLSPQLSESLRALSRQEGVTLFMTLLAAFKTLLCRYTGQDDILVGSPIANRTRAEIEGLVGFFVNTLVLRTDLSGNPSFRELMGRVREVALEAATHQDLPFEKLVDELQPTRDLSRTPLFQVVFVLANVPRRALALSGLTLRPLEVEGGTAKFDLTLYMTDTKQGLAGRVEYNTDLFDDATISRMLGHFQTLLEGLVENPDRRLADLPLLTDDERHQLLHVLNKAERVSRRGLCLQQWFEAQVEHTPNHVAIVFEGEPLTYRELNARANQLAHYLRTLGVKPDVLVGMYMERSLEMVIGILGILKAGGAYVPMDPAYPRERLAFMLEETQTPVLLTQQSLRAGLPEHTAHVICLDTQWDTMASERADNPLVEITPDALAYVIYTSGSTGQPKGVLVTHYQVVRLFEATHAWYQFDASDVWTLFHSYAFDFSVWELWGALLYGGRLVIVPYWVSRSPDAFYELLGREQVTVLNQTPSAFRQLIQAEEQAESRQQLALRLVIFGGEALELQSLRPWIARHGDQRPQLVNMYGITETTVHVTYRPITAADVSQAAGSVIGRALPDLHIYIFDQHWQPVPIGIPGEMYIGGAGVARGYLHRPELTAERFLPDPWSNDPAARLYKTGDLARYLPGGDIEYLGRIDQQVKIRGFRIELGEIEIALAQHAAVREVVVLAREDTPQDKRLVAYVVVEDPAPAVTALRDFLKGTLPDYMIPAAFVMLDALPLTANGKLDRQALPAPDTSRPALTETWVAPTTPTEATLASIWAAVLGLERVGVKDNFFTLGGDSILSIQIIARAHQAGLRLTPKQLFQHQT